MFHAAIIFLGSVALGACLIAAHRLIQHVSKTLILDSSYLILATLISAAVVSIGPKKTALNRKIAVTYFFGFAYAIFAIVELPKMFLIIVPLSMVVLGYSILTNCPAERPVLVFILFCRPAFQLTLSPFGVLFLLPASHFAALFLITIFTKGIGNFLAFLFPPDSADIDRVERIKLIRWWSFLYYGKLFFDEQADLNLDYDGLKNVESSSRSSLKESDYFQTQSADMLSKALTTIKRRDGNFSYENFLTRADLVFKKVHAAIYANNFSDVEYLMSDSLVEQFKRMSVVNSTNKKRISVELVINDLKIAQVNIDKNFDVLHLFVRAVSYDYEPSNADTKLTAEEIRKAKKRLKENVYTEYYTFIRKPSALTKNTPGLLEGRCPNCGAPIQIGQSTRCPACSSFLRSGAYDWVLTKITPASAWQYTEPTSIPGYNDLIESDPDFSLQQIEDRIGVTFWQIKAHEANPAQAAENTTLKRLTTSHYYNFFVTSLKNKAKCANLPKFVSFENFSLKAIKADDRRERCYALVLWNGQTSEIKKIRDVYVMSRNLNGRTPANSTLSSIHCTNCGAPLASSLDVSCSFCQTILNDGNEWLLERIIAEQDLEFRELTDPKPVSMPIVGAKTGEPHTAAKNADQLIMISAQVLMADGRIDDKEMQLLRTIAAKHNVSEEELTKIIENIRSGLVFVPIPAGGSVASLDLIRDAAKMAGADGEITQDEIEAIMNLGYQLGYTKFDVKTIINKELTALKKNAAKNTGN